MSFDEHLKCQRDRLTMVISIKYIKISFQNVCIFISGSSGAASHEELSIKKTTFIPLCRQNI